jgi:hypothetical protein
VMRFKKGTAVHIKFPSKEYTWPCVSDPNRKWTLYDDDVLTKEDAGTYSKHTGLGMFGLHVPDEDVVPFDRDVRLELI